MLVSADRRERVNEVQIDTAILQIEMQLAVLHALLLLTLQGYSSSTPPLVLMFYDLKGS